jgi:hypothetical protein
MTKYVLCGYFPETYDPQTNMIVHLTAEASKILVSLRKNGVTEMFRSLQKNLLSHSINPSLVFLSAP